MTKNYFTTMNHYYLLLIMMCSIGVFGFTTDSNAAPLYSVGTTAANDFAWVTPPDDPCCLDNSYAWVNTIDQSGTYPTGTPRFIDGDTDLRYTIPTSTYPAAFSGPITLTINEAISWDGYSSRNLSATQSKEQWKLVFLKNGVKQGETPYTQDLEDGIISAQWKGELGSVTLPNGVDEIIIVHWEDPLYGNGSSDTPNSVIPSGLCISYEPICNLDANLGGDIADFCSGTTKVLTPTVTGAPTCKTVVKKYKINDSNTEAGCFTANPGFIFQKIDGCSKIDVTWKVTNDLFLREYSDNTADITGTVINEAGEKAAININLSGKENTGTTWDASCYTDGISGAKTFYRNFEGTITVNHIPLAVGTRFGAHFILAQGAGFDDNQYGLGAWTGGDFGTCTEWFGNLQEVSIAGENESLDYLWSTGETSPTITITKPGVYTVKVTACNGCESYDEIIVADNCEVECTLDVSLGDDIEICNEESVTLTAEVSGIAECNEILKEYKITDGDTSGGCFTTPGTGVIFQKENCSVAQHTIWKAGDDLKLTEYTNGTAKITGTVKKGSTIGTVIINLEDKANSGNTWNKSCYTDGLSGVSEFYTTFHGVITINGTDYTVGSKASDAHYIIGQGASLNPNEFGFGAWTGGSFGECTEWFGDLTPITTTIPSGTVNYLWSNGETTPSITVTESGKYTVEVTDCAGCVSTDEINVSIKEVEAIICDDQTICFGEETTLSVEGDGTYLWSTGAKTASIKVSPKETTTYTVKVTNDGCEANAEVTVTVKEEVTASINGGKTICKDEETTLTAVGSGSYLWSNGATTKSINVSPEMTTKYSVTITKDGCEATAEATIIVVDKVTALLGEDQTICLGEEVTLTAEGDGTYLWSNGKTTKSIKVSPEATTTYTVTIGNGTCEATDDVLVTVVPKATANAGADKTICVGEQVTLTAQGVGTVLWSNGATAKSIKVSPEATTTYTVTFDNGTCSAEDKVVVNVVSKASANAGADQTICLGEEVTLTVAGEGSYLWSNGATTKSITVSPKATTTYSVTIDNGTCEASDDVLVTVIPKATASVSDDVTICLGEETTLTAQGVGNVLWSNGETTKTITVSPKATTTYTATFDNGTCNAAASAIVTVVPKATANAGDDVTICVGEEVTLTAQGVGNVLWSNGKTTKSITVNPVTTTTYSVVFDNDVCSATDKVIVTVVPKATANAGKDVTICVGEETTLTAVGEGNVLWSTGETTSSIVVSPASTTEYTVTIDNDVCDASDAVVVTVVPKATANIGDDVTICYGETTELTVVGEGTYLWSTGATTKTITVAPNDTETYSVTVDNGVCTATDEITVNVNPEVIALLGEDKTICIDEEITLTVEGEGTYLWSTGEVTKSITVSPQATTEYSVIVTNNGCDAMDDMVVTVENKVTIGNYVWLDENRNGIQDDGNAGIDDVTVSLYLCDGTLVDTTKTVNTASGSGYYEFEVCQNSGDYYIQFDNTNDELKFTDSTIGDDTKDSNANTAGKTECFTVTNENNITIDAGLVYICDMTLEVIDEVKICPASTVELTAEFNDNSGVCEGGCVYPVKDQNRCNAAGFVGGNYEIWLSNNEGYNASKSIFKASEQKFETFSDGSIRYTAISSNDYDTIEVEAILTGYTKTPIASGAKENLCQDYDTSDWEYWTTWSGTITSKNHGTFTLSLMGEYFQMGYGADVLRSGFGASGWFYASGGDGYYTGGDINVALDQCIEKSASFTWSTTDGEIASDPNQKTITVSSPGTYTITAKNCIDCEETRTVVVTEDRLCGNFAKVYNNPKISKMYPVPAVSGGLLNLEFDLNKTDDLAGISKVVKLQAGNEQLSAEKEEVTVQIFDMHGRLVSTPESYEIINGKAIVHIYLDYMQAGKYFVKVEGTNWSDSKTVIVE